ncbi:MAG: hypothetical protein WCG09_11085 [Halobacteriota archaeon]
MTSIRFSMWNEIDKCAALRKGVKHLFDYLEPEQVHVMLDARVSD